MKIKANLAQGIKEMVEVATNKRWQENIKNKHRNDARYGWYRYNSRFALPVTNQTGKIISFNIFKAVIIVRYAKDKKLYLYDIQDIKKETSTPL